MHRLVASSLPPAELCGDPEETQRQTEELSKAVRIERATAAPGLEVNGPFPRIGGFEVMSRIEVPLPPLPEELAFRVVNRDLILVDVQSNLIVDILHDALPLDRPAPEPAMPGGPCALHPMCWS